MNSRIIYSKPVRYEVDGKEVSEAEYKRHIVPERLRDLLESGIAPHCVTDSTFMRGHANGSEFEKTPHFGDHYKKVCEANGGSVKGKRYLSQLARYPGDPRAWVGGRGDVQKVCEQEGWACEGAVSVKKRELLNPPEPGPALAADIVAEKVKEICATVPNPHLVDKHDLAEQVIERHGRKKKR